MEKVLQRQRRINIWKAMKNNTLQNYMRFAPLVALLVVWEVAVRSGFANPFFISSPSVIVKTGVELIASGAMTPHIITSIGAVFGALAISLVVGTALGVGAGFYKKMGSIMAPYLFTMNSLPIIAITPLLILWFGFGLVAKVVIITLMAIIPIIIAVMDGAKSVDRNLIMMARLYKANDWMIIRSIVMYHAMPFLYSGARVAVGRAFIGLVVAEIFGYNQGLGYLIALYSSNYQTGALMFTILLLLLCNVIIVQGVTMMEKKFTKWK